MATELFAAIKKGDMRGVERLLERDRTLVDARDEAGLSPVLAALYHGQNDVAAAILRRRPTLSVFEAAAAGDATRVREIVGADRAQANAVSLDGYSPLGLAAFFKRREVVRYLLQAGADPRPASRQGGFTPLHSAVATDAGESDVEIVGMLLESGADPNARSQSGSTPLHTVAFTGDRASLDLLMAHGADPAIRSADGKTARDLAVERGHDEVADALARATKNRTG
jgi:ankyrin repeat protein